MNRRQMAETATQVETPKARPTYGAKPSPGQVAVIKGLGGPTTVAEICDNLLGYRYTPQAICMWKKRGIPPAFKAQLAAEARRRGVKIPADY